VSMRKFSKSRRTALAGGAALVLGSGVAAGVAAAQQQPSPKIETLAEPGEADVLFFNEGQDKALAERRQEWLKAVAGKLGVTPERLDQALQDVAREQGMPMPMMMPFPPIAVGAPGTFSIRVDPGLTPAAKALGLTEDQLKTEVSTKSLNEVAKAHNVDPKVVADALKAQRRADIDAAVGTGKLTAQLADRLKAHVDEEIDHLMQVPGFRGRGVFRIERSDRGAP
jgi:hypothetical protein